jgi:hypothetical protein
MALQDLSRKSTLYVPMGPSISLTLNLRVFVFLDNLKIKKQSRGLPDRIMLGIDLRLVVAIPWIDILANITYRQDTRVNPDRNRVK